MASDPKGRATEPASNVAAEVADTSRGPVEFARVGNPPYILFLHGSPGGYDQGVGNDDFSGVGFGTISVSRPGYLGTPLSTGPSMATQADAMAALLDVLGVDQVVPHGVSGGGPSAIQFAARHPDRTSALLLSCAITQQFVVDSMPGWLMRLFMSEASLRVPDLGHGTFPQASIEAMLRAESTFDKPARKRVATEIANSPERLSRMRAISVSVSGMKHRIAGFENDIAQFAAIEQLPLEDIRCPALICHGTADGDVPFAHAETAHRRIPNARLHRIENGWHVLWVGDGTNEMIRIQQEFIAAHAPTG